MATKKLKLCILLAVAVLALTGGVAYAIYSLSIPSHIRIIQVPGGGGGEPTIALAFFADEACTQPITSVEWGDIQQNANVTRDIFYTKNISTSTVTIVGSSTFPQALGTLTITFKKGPNYQASVALTIGEVVQTRGTLAINSQAPLGDTNFNITVGAQ